MLTSFEVGAILAIEDRATPFLNTLADRFEQIGRLASTLKEKLSALGSGAPLSMLQGQVDALAGAFTGAAEAAERLRAVTAEPWTTGGPDAASPAATAAASAYDAATAAANRFREAASRPLPPLLAAPSSADAGDSGSTALSYTRDYGPVIEGEVFGGFLAGGGGGGGRMPPLSPRGPAPAGKPGSLSSSLGSDIFELAAGFSTYESLKVSAEEELNITKGLLDMGLKKGTPAWNQAFKIMRDAAYRAAQGTKFSEGVSAAGIPLITRELSPMLPDYGTLALVNEVASIYPTALRAAEVSELMGLGKAGPTLPAFVEYAHMTGTYDPAKLRERLNVLRNVATATNKTAPEEEKILSYIVPVARAAGMDPDQAAILTGFLQLSGFNSTTAGTGLAQMILSLYKSGTPEQRKAAGSRGLLNALGLKPGQNARDLFEHGRAGALHALGITDDKGKLTVLNDKGGLDAMKLIGDVVKYSETHTDAETLSQLAQAFTTRGTRQLGVLDSPDIIKKLQTFYHNEMNAPDADTVQNVLSGTTLQQFGVATARVSDLFNTMGTAILPAVNAGLQAFSGTLSGFNSVLKASPGLAGMGGGAMLGASSGALVGAVAGFMLTHSLAGARTGAAVGGLLGGTGGAALGGANSGGLRMIPKPDMDPSHPHVGLPAVLHGLWNSIFGGSPAPASPLPYAGSPNFHRESYTPGEGGIVINIGTINGAPTDPDGTWVRRIMHALTEELSRSLMFNSGPGWGSHSSPYENAIGAV